MKRVDIENIANEATMAIITDEDNNAVYDADSIRMYRGESQGKIMKTSFKMNVKSTREKMDENVEKVITFLTELNKAFNRTVGAPESMKLFKVIDKKARYAGNDTVSVELSMATLATGAGSAIYTLLDFRQMSQNLLNTQANVFTASYEAADETYGLGNALRSWKTVMRKYGTDGRSTAAA